MQAKPRIICLMGPTASGKTPLAVELVQRFPCEIISVDSAMIYRGMDIGTAKPDNATLRIAPHRLLDILDPSEHYSAGQFCKDALVHIREILAKGKTPLLVGGTMMYFRALQKGIATMPGRDEGVRQALVERAEKEGWPALHQTLSIVDPDAAARISVSDTQRIQRALEVYMLTGETISAIQRHHTNPMQEYDVLNLALMPESREFLHERIAQRFHQMLDQGFIHEAHKLYKRADLNADMPSMRSVGYRQAWDYFSENISYDEMVVQAITATRQLAKRQMTWLRSWENVHMLTAESPQLVDDALSIIS